jgi:hypothetical protein
LLSWIVLGAAATVFTGDRVRARRVSIVFPPVFLMAGCGAHRIGSWLEKVMPSGVRIAADAACLVILACCETIPKYFREWPAIRTLTTGSAPG